MEGILGKWKVGVYLGNEKKERKEELKKEGRKKERKKEKLEGGGWPSAAAAGEGPRTRVPPGRRGGVECEGGGGCLVLMENVEVVDGGGGYGGCGDDWR